MQVMKRNVELQDTNLQSSTILLIIPGFLNFFWPPLFFSLKLNAILFTVYSKWAILISKLDGALVFVEMDCEELDWGNEDHLQHIKDNYPDGFDLILGADIYILSIKFSTSLESLKSVSICAELWVTNVATLLLHMFSC